MAFSDTTFERGKTTLTAELMNSLCDELKSIKANLWKQVYPVGAIIFSTNAANPSTYLGGTWESYGAGRVPLFAGTGTDEKGVKKTFTAGELVGCYNMQNHNHDIPSHTHDASITGGGAHTHYTGSSSNGAASGSKKKVPGNAAQASSSGGSHTHGITISPSGDSISGNKGTGNAENIQPCVVLYGFRRVS